MGIVSSHGHRHTAGRGSYIWTWFATMLIWIEPALNQEMVRAVLTESQTSDCDVRCLITLSFQRKFHVNGPHPVR